MLIYNKVPFVQEMSLRFLSAHFKLVGKPLLKLS